MAAGKYRTRINFERETRLSDGGGGSATSWVPLFSRDGHFRPETGRERLQAGRINEAAAAVLRIRSGPEARTLTTADRAVVGGVVYQIRGLSNPDARDKELELALERGVVT